MKDYGRYCESLPDGARIPSLMEWRGQPNSATMVQTDLKQALSGCSFSSSEEAENFIRNLTQQQNDTTVADFCGLSSQQMHSILYDCLAEMSGIVTLNEQLSNEQALSSPLIAGIKALLSFIAGKNGQIKLTPSLALPRAAIAACIPYCNPSWRPGDPVPKEWNSVEVQLVRDIALNLRLLDTKNNLLFLSPEGIQVHQQQPWAKIYRDALEHLLDEYDWLYFLDESHWIDHFNHIPDSAVFGLWLLHCYPKADIADYHNHFRQAFPAFYQPAQNDSAILQMLDNIIEGMFFISFAQTLGLIEYTDPECRSYRTTSLFHDSFQWQIKKPVSG